MKRVQTGKTIQLGTWTNTLATGVKSLYKASTVRHHTATRAPGGLEVVNVAT